MYHQVYTEQRLTCDIEASTIPGFLPIQSGLFKGGKNLLSFFKKEKLKVSQRRIYLKILELIKKWREVERCGWKSHRKPHKEKNQCS
jgi:hypothetical protein